jgi:hypothetical protein
MLRRFVSFLSDKESLLIPWPCLVGLNWQGLTLVISPVYHRLLVKTCREAPGPNQTKDYELAIDGVKDLARKTVIRPYSDFDIARVLVIETRTVEWILRDGLPCQFPTTLLMVGNQIVVCASNEFPTHEYFEAEQVLFGVERRLAMEAARGK